MIDAARILDIAGCALREQSIMVSRGGNYYPYQYCVATINQEGQLSLTAQLYGTSDYTMDSFSASLIDYLANANMVIVDDRKRHEMAFRKLGECSKSWRHTLIDIQKTLIGFDDLFANQPPFLASQTCLDSIHFQRKQLGENPSILYPDPNIADMVLSTYRNEKNPLRRSALKDRLLNYSRYKCVIMAESFLS